MSKRVVRQVGNTTTSVVSQHVTGTKYHQHIVETRSDMDPVIEHVRRRHAEVNEHGGGRYMGEYIGSIDQSMLVDWLKARGLNMNDYATNRDQTADKFKAWFLGNRDLTKFHARTYSHVTRKTFG